MHSLSGRYCRVLFASLALVCAAVTARAQTVVVNPTTLTFTPSADQTAVLSDGQPALDHYNFDVYTVGATQPFQSTNIGKPAPQSDGLIHYVFSTAVAGWPLPGGNYEARVAAVGPNGTGTSTVSNAFTFSTCGTTLSGTSATLPAAGGGTQFGVTTGASCAWTASPSASWIAASPASGTGNATVVVSVAANTSTSARTGTVSVGGQQFTVNQLGASCTFSLSATAQSFPATGGSGSVGVTGNTGCAWNATSNASWLSVTPASGSGSATVSYSVAANTSTTSRTGTLTIAGATYTVNQAGAAATTTTTLPSPWQTQDIGTVGLAGSASYSSGVFTVVGSGADIWGTTDAFRFVDQPLNGDGQITARVVSETNTNYYAKAGIMLRTSLTSNSPHVILDLMPNGNIEFMTRSASGGSTTSLANATQAAPAWLRLTRAGSTITAAVSADGVTWRSVGSTTTALGTSVFAGLVVTSHDTTLRNTATFDNVTVGTAVTTTGLPTPWTNQDVGSVGLAGSATYSSGTFSVTGAGADIWGTTDAFQFVRQGSAGDGQIVARMTGEQNTNYYAKAGIMYRVSTAANAAFVMLDVMPGGGVEFMARSSAGGAVAYLAGTTRPAPAWLRLVRSGSTVTASVSADGATWTTVGSTSITLGTTASVGLVVTSHDTTVRNTARFDNVTVR